MKKKFTTIAYFAFTTSLMAATAEQMNKAFNALSDLIPYITHRERFLDKSNEKIIVKEIEELKVAFKNVRHEALIKEDIFHPSYDLINDNINGTLSAFKNNRKDYAHWRLKETTSLCIDCHTRLPISYSSSFQNGKNNIDNSKFDNAYDLGIANLLVRRYVDAKNSFLRSIDDKMIKKQTDDIILPFKQILLIETKALKNPANMLALLDKYKEKKEIPQETHLRILSWINRLNHWKNNPLLAKGIQTDKELDQFIDKVLIPLTKKPLYNEGFDVDLLFVSGLLANYYFENPATNRAPEISYWMGWSEKYLKRERFFSSGDLFLKQCIKRYYFNPIAKKCFEEYKESIEFDFSGSSGTHIPEDLKKELDDFSKLINKK
ncbi:MAG: hypothetical protein AB7I27_02165 [Bacteriovoracaceae bacterium]